ncbi:MAG: hypothetical protein LBR55_03175 [Bacteroidales bacterium]|jgi:hypothetical protein|nr:hypothetical protein [Bacteroidales bacterium]
MNNSKFLFLSALCALCIACSEKQAHDDTNIAAHFNDEYLYTEQIMKLIPPNSSKSDSVEFIKTYIHSWIMNKALYEKAGDNISFNNTEIEEQVQQFRTALYINKYEELFAQQKLDTLITITQLDTYYATHKAEFILNDDVVKPLFMVLPKQFITQKIRQNFTSNNVDDLDHLIDLCYQHSSKFYLGDSWVNLDQLKQEIPKQVSTQELVNPKGLIIDFEDNVYFIKISNYIQAGSFAPREMVYEKIASILLYKRRIELLNTMRNKVYQDALRKKQFEIFYQLQDK